MKAGDAEYDLLVERLRRALDMPDTYKDIERSKLTMPQIFKGIAEGLGNQETPIPKKRGRKQGSKNKPKEIK